MLSYPHIINYLNWVCVYIVPSIGVRVQIISGWVSPWGWSTETENCPTLSAKVLVVAIFGGTQFDTGSNSPYTSQCVKKISKNKCHQVEAMPVQNTNIPAEAKFGFRILWLAYLIDCTHRLFPGQWPGCQWCLCFGDFWMSTCQRVGLRFVGAGLYEKGFNIYR